MRSNHRRERNRFPDPRQMGESAGFLGVVGLDLGVLMRMILMRMVLKRMVLKWVDFWGAAHNRNTSRRDAMLEEPHGASKHVVP